MRRLSWSVGRDIAIAYGYLLLAGWQMFVRRRRLDSWLRRRQGGVAPTLTEGTDLHRAQSFARWINAAARYPIPWARCLQRSLALCLWLEREGFQPELTIGVRIEGADLEAHAWVEYYGEVINDTPDVSEEFAPLTGSTIGWPETGWERDGS